ncbi:MAG: small-conductance mechanosensitive ion channel [Candidatus Eremiobacter antarcticus]|nr:small-conductance mechanosensitive ion channel [Candidatus Eremiobacteraeota bacterium]PZR63481.1 MAG: small-conductance mechanosensitive ion channel [Candidatus Eremiobacter sp. RRmetagenome_bin22]
MLDLSNFHSSLCVVAAQVSAANDVAGWASGLAAGIAAGLSAFMSGIPRFLGAIVLLIIGWIIAGIIAALAVKLFKAIHTDTVADRIGANDFLQRSGSKMRASDILGEFIKWIIRLVFIEMAADALGLPQITAAINGLLAFIPNVIVALFILGIGLFLGRLLAGVVRGSASEAGIQNPEMLAKLANWAVIAFAIIAAMNQVHVAAVVVNTLYIGLVAALALALGLAFGLGGKDVAGELAQNWLGQAQERSSQGDITPRPRSGQ